MSELIRFFYFIFYSIFQEYKKYNQIAMIMEIKKAQSVQTDASFTIEGFDDYLQLSCKLFTDLLEQQQGPCNSIFNCESLPSIDLRTYIRNIHTFTNFSQECLLIAIIYLDRYNLAKEDFYLHPLNIHRIYLTCLLLATKFQDDIYYDNKSFELAGGVSTQQLLEYELEISNVLDFNFFVSTEQYKKLFNKLQDAYTTID